MLRLLVNQSGHPQAYYRNNVILHIGTGQVLAVVLGSCVFNTSGQPAGRFLNGIFFNQEGEQVAALKITDPDALPHTPPDVNYEQIWHLIRRIRRHDCLASPAHSRWSPLNLYQLLNTG